MVATKLFMYSLLIIVSGRIFGIDHQSNVILVAILAELIELNRR